MNKNQSNQNDDDDKKKSGKKIVSSEKKDPNKILNYWTKDKIDSAKPVPQPNKKRPKDSD